MQHVLQARRRQRIVRSVLAAAALLVAGHYASLLVRVQSCHRSGSSGGSTDGRLASDLQSGAGADAPRVAAWPAEGESKHAGDSGRADSAGAGGTHDAGGATRNPRGGGRHSIPRILHQSWKDEHVPKRFHKWQVCRGSSPQWNADYSCPDADIVVALWHMLQRTNPAIKVVALVCCHCRLAGGGFTQTGSFGCGQMQTTGALGCIENIPVPEAMRGKRAGSLMLTEVMPLPPMLS